VIFGEYVFVNTFLLVCLWAEGGLIVGGVWHGCGCGGAKRATGEAFEEEA
jgi:hypothetical protein